MKKKYYFEKISTIVCLLLILFATWQQFQYNHTTLIVVFVIVYSLLKNKFFKNAEYENKKDYVFNIINLLLLLPTLFLSIYMVIYR